MSVNQLVGGGAHEGGICRLHFSDPDNHGSGQEVLKDV